MKLESFYSNLSIKYKFIIFYFSIILVLALLFGTFSYYNSRKYVFNSANRANSDKVKQITTSIDYLRKDIYDVSTIICLTPSIQKFLRNSKNLHHATDFNNDSQELIDYIIASKSYISLIIIYNAQGFPVYYKSSDMSSGAKSLNSANEAAIYKKACALSGKPLWLNINNHNQVLIEDNKSPKIAECRVIKDIYTMNNMGLIVICVNEREITKLFSNNIKKGENISIFDNHHVVLSFGNQMVANTPITSTLKKDGNTDYGYFVKKLAGKDMLISYSTSALNDWIVFDSIPAAQLLKEINSIKSFSIIVVIACIIVTLPLTLLISSYLTAPIKRLLVSMKQFQQGSFDERVEIKYDDEIGKLGAGYNRMVSNVKDLINNVYVLQIKEREAELNALQAQINPHFLYNTLDTIYWKAEKQGQEELGEMVYSLSRLFRLSLNRGKEFTLVSSEKELIEHYLKLQKVRFKDKLNYALLFDDEVMDYILPKLILQPFVENAILHGLESKKMGGFISISGKKEKNSLSFSIEDNGKGMDEATLQKLLSLEPDDDSNGPIMRSGYAVKNVIERLNIYFGKDYRLNIFSKVESGTRIEIIIPAQKFLTNEEVSHDQTPYRGR
ncbi:MAG TPA: hypothetical protein DDW65_14930 [Firmicutes bacterium]|jgi:two-component system, sensor histidine kinase YesM|nr:hypothetical protein [Bacillota bacterium]